MSVCLFFLQTGSELMIHHLESRGRMANRWVDKFITSWQVASVQRWFKSLLMYTRAFWLCGSVLPRPWFSLSSAWQLANSINFFLAEQERDQWKVNVVRGSLIQLHPEPPLHCELQESGHSGRQRAREQVSCRPNSVRPREFKARLLGKLQRLHRLTCNRSQPCLILSLEGASIS